MRILPKQKNKYITSDWRSFFWDSLKHREQELITRQKELKNEEARDKQTLVGDVSHYPVHPASEPFEENRQEVRMQLLTMIRTELVEVQHSIEKLQNGNFGICEESGKNIDLGRLMANPTARYSIEAQEKHELSSPPAIERRLPPRRLDQIFDSNEYPDEQPRS